MKMVSSLVKNPFSKAEKEIFKPRPFMYPTEWAEQNIRINVGPAKGFFSAKTMPVLNTPINSICNSRYESIIGVAATQAGKSLSLNQIPIGYGLEYERRHTAFGIPNQKLARKTWTTKLAPMWKAVPALNRLLPKDGAGSKGGFPTEQILKNGATWIFLGAGSAVDTASSTVEWLIVDEADKSDETSNDGEANKILQMIRRTDAFQLDRKLIFTCTPTTEDAFIWRSFKSGTEGRPYFRCLCCGEWFCFEWDFKNNQLAWSDDSSEISAELTAYYACPHCEYHINDEERLKMLQHPLWVHAGEKIETCTPGDVAAKGYFDEGVVIGNDSFVVTGKRKEVKTLSFWWNRLVSPFTTLGILAGNLKKAKDNASERHAISIYDMALPWKDDSSSELSVKAEEILEHKKWADYTLGKIPFKVNPLFPQYTNGNKFRPRIIAIDAGYQDTKNTRIEAHEKQVYAFCLKAGQADFRAVKGVKYIDGGQPFEMRLQGGLGNKVFYTLLDTDILKTEVMEQEAVKPGGYGVRYIPKDIDDYYARSMASERRVIKIDEKTNMLKSSWEKIDPENHKFDTRVYSWGAARIAGVKPPRLDVDDSHYKELYTVITMGIDIHLDWATWVVDAWRVDREGYLYDSWLIDCPRTMTKFNQIGYVYPGMRTPSRIYNFLESVIFPLVKEGYSDIA